MGLLPDLDENGYLKKEKKAAVVKTTGYKKSFLSWENLLENRCPSCQELFPQREGDRECKNHVGNSFKVPAHRFRDIVRNLQEREDFKFPKF